MKENILYECEFCHTQYRAKTDAESCESNHKHVKEVDKEHFLAQKNDRSGHPVFVILLMDNGEKFKYVRTGPAI